MDSKEAITVLNELKKLCKRNYIDPNKYLEAIDIGISAIQIMVGEYIEKHIWEREE